MVKLVYMKLHAIGIQMLHNMHSPEEQILKNVMRMEELLCI